MKILALIPARGGSKGVPRKNLRPLAGRPLIAWSIDAAAEIVSIPGADVRVCVSTEDPEIERVASSCGAVVTPRPDALATDTATTDAVILHAVDYQKPYGWRPDLVVLLQATVPVRAPGLVRACVERLLVTDADSLLTGYPLHFVWWRESEAYRYTAGPGATGHPEAPTWRSQCPRRPRRQDMTARELMFHEDGSVYVTRTDLIEKTGARLGGRMELFETTRTVDIDTEEDFAVAEALMRARLAVPA